MPHDATTGIASTASSSVSPGRRLFAPPSRDGLLICAASLMPAYLFGLLGYSQILSLLPLLQAGPAADPRGPAAGLLEIVHALLTITFTLLACWLFLIRRPSARPRGAGGRIADLAAVAGTTIVVGIASAPRTVESALVLAAADALLTVGLSIAIAGLASLGRSFGIMPRARGLVRSGLYRWVRHPIYLGEFLAFGGLLLLAISPVTLAVYAAFVALQLYRARQEERTLLAVYPEYAQYQARTARFLPGVY